MKQAMKTNIKPQMQPSLKVLNKKKDNEANF